MSGIAGILEKREEGTPDLAWVLECMLDLMRHRGPDGFGMETRKGLLLGRVGHSKLDSNSDGVQSISLDGGRWAIGFDGRLFNRSELRLELEAGGVVFSGDTDEEFVLNAYRHWGLDCFRRFNGMWALAVWDRDENRLVLSRDRVGIKPLYWCADGDRLAFASEIKALAAFRRLTGRIPEINPESIRSFLNSALTDGMEETFFHGILHFRPGHFMVIEKGSIRTCQSYWDLPQRALELREENKGRSESETAGRLFQLMEDSVKIHARSDGPVGVYLSGDLDSSAAAGLGRRSISNIKTFTPRFENDAAGVELENARQMRIAFDFDWSRIEVKGWDLMDRLPDILWRLEEPFMDMSVYPQWVVMEKAAKEVTVMLDGLGGDELFAGLPSHAARRLYGMLASGRTDDYRSLLNGFVQNDGRQRAEALGKEADGLLSGNGRRDLPDLFPGHLDNFLFYELTRSRLPALLRCRDRLASAFSVEYRAPLLDFRLMEAAFSLEEERKIEAGWSKYIMRRALDGFLPYDITWGREIKGFPSPFQFWAGGFHNLAMRELLLGHQSYLKSTIGEDLLFGFFQAWDRGHTNHWQLWHLVSLEMWLQTWLKRLTEEINRSLEKRDGQIDLIPSGYQPVQPLEVVMAVEYGGLYGHDANPGTVRRFDYKNDLIDPTEDLVRLVEKQGARLTLLWDAADYFRLEENGLDAEARAVQSQLRDVVGRGHDVQLYLNPVWLNGPAKDLEALVEKSIRTMTQWFRPLRSDYAARGIRTGIKQVERLGQFVETLMKYGLKADNSLHGFGPLGVKTPRLNEQAPLEEADFIEYPVLAQENELWDLNESALLPVSKLKGEPPANPPFGSTLVMAGRIRGPVNLFELDLCLNHLKQQYGSRLWFRRWQESIDRRLSVMRGEWRPKRDTARYDS